RGGHKRGQGAREQGPESQAGKVRFSARSQSPDPSDLNSDRRKIGEPAERKRRDEPSLLGQSCLNRRHLRVGEEFVDDRFVADQVPAAPVITLRAATE